MIVSNERLSSKKRKSSRKYTILGQDGHVKVVEKKAAVPMAWEVRLHGVLETMGDAERRVADHFRTKGFAVLTQSIAQISAETGASEATIVRFCRHVGFGGLKDFKIALAKEQSAGASDAEVSLSWNDSMKKVRDKVFTDAIGALKDSMALADPDSLERSVDAMIHARHIDLYAAGCEEALAIFLHDQLLQIGFRTDIHATQQAQHTSSTLLEPGDVAVAFSSDGNDPNVVDAMARARTQGATTISVTGKTESPLAKASDILLVTAGGPVLLSGQQTLSRFSQLAIVNTLYLGIALSLGEDTVESAYTMVSTPTDSLAR